MGLEKLGGPVFICWRGGKPPKDKKVKCSVCKTRWSTLLCDGATKDPGRTCDAPLCEACTTRPAPLIVLPPHDNNALCNDMEMLLWARRKELRDRKHERRMRDDIALDPKRPTHVELPPDTRDFCPACVARMNGPKQGRLF